MRAVRVHHPGGPEVLRLEDLPEPVAGPGQAVVQLEAIGLNYIDTYHRSGLYPVPPPFTPGQEGAGVVVAVGPDAGDVRPGDRVAWCSALGSYAERHVVPVARLVPVPDALDMSVAAGVLLQGITAHYLATSTGALGPGDVCLVHAAAGGVGQLLCQIARRRGATVIGTASTPDKVRLAEAAGAQHVIRYTEVDFEAEVRRITGGAGVRVVYDGVGADTFERSLRCLRRRGLMVLYGQSSGPVPPFDLNRLNALGSLYVTRPSIGAYTASRDELLARARDVFDWVGDGTLRVRIGATFPLARAADAHRALEGRQTAGKVLLLPRET